MQSVSCEKSTRRQAWRPPRADVPESEKENAMTERAHTTSSTQQCHDVTTPAHNTYTQEDAHTGTPAPLPHRPPRSRPSQIPPALQTFTAACATAPTCASRRPRPACSCRATLGARAGPWTPATARGASCAGRVSISGSLLMLMRRRSLRPSRGPLCLCYFMCLVGWCVSWSQRRVIGESLGELDVGAVMGSTARWMNG